MILSHAGAEIASRTALTFAETSRAGMAFRAYFALFAAAAIGMMLTFNVITGAILPRTRAADVERMSRQARAFSFARRILGTDRFDMVVM
jgi:hypothetical protein